jgi:hypothetical protein
MSRRGQRFVISPLRRLIIVPSTSRAELEGCIRKDGNEFRGTLFIAPILYAQTSIKHGVVELDEKLAVRDGGVYGPMRAYSHPEQAFDAAGSDHRFIGKQFSFLSYMRELRS